MSVEPIFSIWPLTYDRRRVRPDQNTRTRSDYGAFLLTKDDCGVSREMYKVRKQHSCNHLHNPQVICSGRPIRITESSNDRFLHRLFPIELHLKLQSLVYNDELVQPKIEVPAIIGSLASRLNRTSQSGHGSTARSWSSSARFLVHIE